MYTYIITAVHRMNYGLLATNKLIANIEYVVIIVSVIAIKITFFS